LSPLSDYFVSLDLTDGYYTLGYRDEDRDFFTVNYQGGLGRLACLPMGWSRLAYCLCKLMGAFTKRTPAPSYAPDRKDDYTSKAHEKIFAQHPLARNSIISLHGRLHVRGPLARSNTIPTRPLRCIATPTRPPTKPQERRIGTHASGRPPQPHDRPLEGRISSPHRQIVVSLQASLNTIVSAAQRATTVGYPPNSMPPLLEKRSFSTSSSRQLVSFHANFTPCWLRDKGGEAESA
jgi:hypothetical protein